MAERNVDYVLEIVDDIPERTIPRSPLEGTLEKIVADYEKLAKVAAEQGKEAKPITAIIALYEKPTACTAAANVLRQRHGTPDVEGWRFETRHVDRDVDDGQGGKTKKQFTALYVSYDPTKMVPGGREAWDRKMKDREATLERKRAERKAAENGQTVGSAAAAQNTTTPASTTPAPAPAAGPQQKSGQPQPTGQPQPAKATTAPPK